VIEQAGVRAAGPDLAEVGFQRLDRLLGSPCRIHLRRRCAVAQIRPMAGGAPRLSGALEQR
jgi:hypothetical protein